MSLTVDGTTTNVVGPGEELVDHSSTALSMENRQTSRAVWIHAIFLKMCAKGGFEVH
jgi:hypothetical protein